MARGGDAGPSSQQVQQTQADRRKLREDYRKLKDRAAAQKDELLQPESHKLQEALLEADALHQQVRKPREQKADADLLAQLTEVTLQAAKQLRPDASLCTPTAFLGRLMTHFTGGMDMEEEEEVSPERFDWQNAGRMIGMPLLASAPGITCMLGPLDSQPKQRKQPQQRAKRKRPEEQTNPDEIVEQTQDGKEKETDANMTTMFEILRRNHGGIPFERLFLNKKSFSQTIENQFSLSFLIKDGRASTRKMDDGTILVEPRNAPSKEELGTGKAETSAFMAKFQYKDWLDLKEKCPGSDYMPTRKGANEPAQPPRNGTPVRKGQGKFRPRENSYSQQPVEEESEEEEEEALVVNRRRKKQRS